MFKKPLTYIIPLPNITSFLGDPSKNFVGRKIIKNNILSALRNALKEGGSFLIGGYRGVGKTTLVKKQIEKLNHQEYKERTILNSRIDLGINAELSAREILCDIAEEFSKSYFRYANRTGHIYTSFFIAQVFLLCYFCLPTLIETCLRLFLLLKTSYGLSILSTLFIYPFLKGIFPFLDLLIKTNNEFSLANALFLSIDCLIILLTFSLVLILISKMKPIYNIYMVSNKLKKLNEGIRYSRAFHKSVSSSSTPINFSIKEVKSEDPISPLRIEQELRYIFDYIAQKRFPMSLKSKREKTDEQTKSVVKSWKWYTSDSKYFLFEKLTRIQPIIIFDELDKINSGSTGNKLDEKGRKNKVDELLGGLKSLLTSSRATFVFISGREMVDAYHSESGYTSALYEGLFNDIFYIPTLLADSSNGNTSNLHNMIEVYIAQLLNWNNTNKPNQQINTYIDKSRTNYELIKKNKEWKKNKNSKHKYCYSFATPPLNGKGASSLHEQNINFVIKLFIYFLTLHSWGNCKRLLTLLKQFLDEYDDKVVNLLDPDRTFIAGGKLKKGDSYLIFNPKQLQRIYVSAKLYTVIENSLAAPLSKTDDKLIVSTLISALDIMKFYGRGFSRDSLDRTVEGINMHSEANLPHIIDDLINSVFFPIIRRTTDNLYDYRFFSTAEEEIRYLSKSLGARASSFEFALDATDPVRSFFINERNDQISVNNEQFNSYHTNGNIEIILGDLCFYERSFDIAYLHYSNAVQVLKRVLRTPDGKDWREKGGMSFSSHHLLITALLKKGLIDEIRENNESSDRHYREARNLALYSFENITTQKGSVDANQKITKKHSPYNSVNLPEDYMQWMLTESKDKVGVRHRGMIIHAVLAAEFLRLKSSREPTRILFGELEDYKTADIEPSLFSKIITLHYYANAHNLILKSNFERALSMLNGETAKDSLTQNDYQIAYLVGQSLFAGHAKNISYKSPDKFLDGWANAINTIISKESGNLDLESQKTDEEISIESTQTNHIDSSLIWLSFQMVFSSAKCFERKGLYGRASQLYLSIIINWISLLEIVPWKEINKITDKQKLETIREKMHLIPKWIDRVIYCAQYAMEKSHQGSFRNERENHLVNSQTIESFDIDKLATNSFFGDSENSSLSSPLVWYRSSHENYLLFLVLWEQFARKAIKSSLTTEEKDKKWNILLCQPIDSLPRVTAGYLWIKSRAGQYSLSTMDQNEQAYVGQCYSVLEGFWQSLVYRKVGVRSEDPDTIPPKSIIFYNMFEVVDELNASTLTRLKNYIQKNVTKNPIPKKYLDKKYLRRNCMRQFLELSDLQEISSNSYRRKVRHKHYLYDDFEDPLYIAEWSYSMMLSVGAIHHYNSLPEYKKPKLTNI